MDMRKSRVLEKVRAGGIATCYKTNLIDGRAVEIAALAGFDCIWSDMEHTANDWSTIEHHVWAAKSAGADLVVRVARGSYSDYIRPFELDASGLIVPHVMSRAEAEQVARMTRFMPVGRRAIDGGNADGRYCNMDYAEYTRQANRERFVIVQIEDFEAMAELEGIAAVAGIDGLFFGPGDFSHSLGIPGQWSDTRIADARRRIAAAAVAHGKFAATVGSPGNLEELVGMGYRFVSLGADVIAIGEQCRTILEAVRPILARNGKR